MGSQRDVLDSIHNPGYKSPEFPAGYWPSTPAPPTKESWDRCVAAFRADLKELTDLASSSSRDLLIPLPNSDGQTILRKLFMAADHNSYHLGQLFLLRQLLQ